MCLYLCLPLCVCLYLCACFVCVSICGTLRLYLCLAVVSVFCPSNPCICSNHYFGHITEDAYRKHINEKNPLGMGGNLAKAYGSLLHEMWSGNTSYTHPRNLKV